MKREIRETIASPSVVCKKIVFTEANDFLVAVEKGKRKVVTRDETCLFALMCIRMFLYARGILAIIAHFRHYEMGKR
jgi:hypothetical protein